MDYVIVTKNVTVNSVISLLINIMKLLHAGR